MSNNMSLTAITEVEGKLVSILDVENIIANLMNKKYQDTIEHVEKVNKTTVSKRLKELEAKVIKLPKKTKVLNMVAEPDEEYSTNEMSVLQQYLRIVEDHAKLNAIVKKATEDLDIKALAQYKSLTEDQIKQMVVEEKWLASLELSIKTEMERISQRLSLRIKELTERYELTLPQLTTELTDLEDKVNAHLLKMGFVWN